MSNLSPFCTCTDITCPMHPTNHDQGCAPCIAKNLALREIPSCFINAVDSTAKYDSFHYEDFAKAVLNRPNAAQ